MLFRSDDELGEHWAWADAFYFVVVSMSTVGYGDLAPSGSGSRLFTAVYIFFGVALVFQIAGGAYDSTMRSLEFLFGGAWQDEQPDCTVSSLAAASHGQKRQPCVAPANSHWRHQRR